MMEGFLTHFRLSRGRIALELRAHAMGRDWMLCLTGGDRPHLGASAVVWPGGAGSIKVPGHREEELARRLAQHASDQLGVAVCVACGIHLEAITASEIQDVLDMSEEMVERFLLECGRG